MSGWGEFYNFARIAMHVLGFHQGPRQDWAPAFGDSIASCSSSVCPLPWQVYTDYCYDAREMLRPLELACAIIATTAPRSPSTV